MAYVVVVSLGTVWFLRTRWFESLPGQINLVFVILGRSIQYLCACAWHR